MTDKQEQNDQDKPQLQLSFTVPHVTIKGVQGSLTITAQNMADLRFSLENLHRVAYITPHIEYVRTPDGDPICAVHLVPMTLREKQGDRWWSHKFYTLDADGTPTEHFCRGYPERKGSGFAIPSDKIAWDFKTEDYENWQKEQQRGSRRKR